MAMLEEMERIEGLTRSRSTADKPTLEELKLHFSKCGGPEDEADKMFSFYSSNGWKVGKNPMKSWQHAAGNWITNWRAKQGVGTISPSVLRMQRLGELKKAEDQLQALRMSYAGHQTWETDDKEKARKLKELITKIKTETGSLI